MAPLSHQLEKIGLSSGEAKVYLAALELGETSVARIAKKAQMERTTCYDVIEALKEKGLISTGKRGKRSAYIAEDPRKIKLRIEERVRMTEVILPELLALANAVDAKPRVRFYENANGLFDIYRETLNYPDQEIRIWMSEGGVWYDDESFWKEIYIPSRLEKRIPLRVIAPNTKNANEMKDADTASLRTTRLLPKEEDTIASEIMLFGGRFIAMISSDEIIGLVIESEKLFKTQKTIFEMQWKALE